jgi:hypothetical protein
MARNRRTDKLCWIPRILSIAFAIFLALFSLDVFESEGSIWMLLLGFLIHNIPAIVVGIIIYLSWDREIIGAVAFILAGFLYIGMIFLNAIRSGFQLYMIPMALTIAGPAFLIGALYLVCWRRKTKSI